MKATGPGFCSGQPGKCIGEKAGVKSTLPGTFGRRPSRSKLNPSPLQASCKTTEAIKAVDRLPRPDLFCNKADGSSLVDSEFQEVSGAR